MSISNLLPVASDSNVSNFHYLVLFICHLFDNGPFRTVHILYNPNVFDLNLLMQIDSICNDPIPLYLTDITQPFQIPYQESDNVDNLLQLFFLDPNSLIHDMDLIGDQFKLYRIFIFSSFDMIRKMNLSLFFETRNPAYDTRTLIVHYNESSVSVYIENSLNEPLNGAIFTLTHEVNLEKVNIFDRTFGAYEQMESIEFHRWDYYTSSDSLKPNFYLFDQAINYYHLHLNQSYVCTIWHNIYNSTIPLIYHRTVIQNPQKYYMESSFDYKIIENDNQ